MELKEIEKIVVDVLEEVQTKSGHGWEGLPATATPIGFLGGFDSLCSIESTVMIEVKLGVPNLGKESLFISDDGTRALTLQEIGQDIKKLLEKLGGKK